MIIMLSFTSLFLSIPFILMSINLILSKKLEKNREKASPYECGFDPMNSINESFSIQFFLISIMFLTFDIEIVVLIPLMLSLKTPTSMWITSSMIILSILSWGLYLEWAENSIKWNI